MSQCKMPKQELAMTKATASTQFKSPVCLDSILSRQKHTSNLLHSDTDPMGLKWEIVNPEPSTARAYDPREFMGSRKNYDAGNGRVTTLPCFGSGGTRQ
jgi:hypothetical protein